MVPGSQPSDEELALVAEHGSGPMVQAIAIVKLTQRADQMEKLRAFLEE